HTRFSRDWSSDVCSSDLGDPAPSIDHLTPEEQAELAATGYELPDSDSQIQFEIDRLDSRLVSLESFFFYIVQLERFYSIEFPAQIGRASCRERRRRSMAA